MRSRFPATCAIALSCLFVCTRATAQQTFDQPYDGARTPRNANYDLSVSLDPASRSLLGIGLIRWRNISNRFTGELRLHIPPGTVVTRMAVADADGAVTAVAVPARGARVELPREVGPFQQLEVHVAWQTRLRGVAPYSMVRWFPKVAVLEDAGWNDAAVHADFGSYDVQITLPPRLLVDASGEQVRRQENADGSVTYRYRAEDVRDFTWSAAAASSGLRPWPLVPLAQAAVTSSLLLRRRGRRRGRTGVAIVLLALAAVPLFGDGGGIMHETARRERSTVSGLRSTVHGAAQPGEHRSPKTEDDGRTND